MFTGYLSACYRIHEHVGEYPSFLLTLNFRMVRLLIIIPLLFTGFVQAQVNSYVISPAGGSFQSSGIKGAWTVGEIAGGASETASVIVNQGFLKNKFIVSVTNTDLIHSESLYQLYPNPASDFIIVKWNATAHSEGVKYSLYDSKGGLLEVSGAEQESQLKKIQMENYGPGLYILLMESPQLQSPVKLKITKRLTHE